jgi:hypothetical protein
VRTVAAILGHADPAMTLRRYAHVLPDMRVRAAYITDSYGSLCWAGPPLDPELTANPLTTQQIEPT